ncbi:MAG: hypothetical protein ABUK01_06515 [Leptospirales bacterium]
MRYRTKKYLKKTLYYSLFTIITSLSYFIAAHKKILPALMEFYTGEAIREATQPLYNYYAIVFEDSEIEVEESRRNMHDYLDIITRESSYLYGKDLLQAKAAEADLSGPFQKEAHVLATHPGLMQWLKNTRGKYAEVFQYEFLRYVKNVDIVKNLTVMDNSGKVLYPDKTKDFEGAIPEKDFTIEDSRFFIKVKSQDVLLGYISAEMDRFGYKLDHFNVPQPAYGITALFVDSKGKVLNRDKFIGYSVEWIRDGYYTGPMGGRKGEARILSQKIGNHNLVFIYEARHWLFYLFKLLFIIALPVTLLIFLLYLRKNIGNIVQWIKAETKGKEILESAILLQKESIEFSKECEEKMVEMRVAELEKLRLIGRHLEGLHSALENRSSDNKLLNTVT